MFQIFAGAVPIIFRPAVTQLMHPAIRFGRCFSPLYRWPVKQINIPGYLAIPPDAGGNGFTDDFIAVVKMLKPAVVQHLDRRNSGIKGIFFKNRNPDNGSADIGMGIVAKYILMYRPGTLIASQRTGRREQRHKSNFTAIRVKSLFERIKRVVQGNNFTWLIYYSHSQHLRCTPISVDHIEGGLAIQLGHHLADITQASLAFGVFNCALAISKLFFHPDLFH
jgi:hypothetical protein